MNNRSDDYFAKTLEKGLRILNLFDEREPAWSQTAIAGKIGMNLTSTYRLVNTFIQLGYLTKDPRTKLLRLGPMAMVLGNRLIGGFDLGKLVKPVVDKIHEQYLISVEVSLLQNDFLVQIYKKEAANTLTYSQDIVSDSLYCTASGKSVLAAFSGPELDTMLARQSFTRRTEQTIVGKEDLLHELEQVSADGYARNDEEYIKGLIAIAAPIFTPNNTSPAGAVCFTTTTVNTLLENFEQNYSVILRDLAEKISALMPSR